MSNDVGSLSVSSRGQMSLPAPARRRWNLADGGQVGYLDLGEAVILVPGGVDQLRSELIDAITPEVWADAANGFGDRDLANE